ncbi:MAG: UDP-3-O-acyl-N-acetylglucosamine deacetylase [Planctomycetia bacterium]|nr:UDP-3-O-acyl-N-acetylglucosamine deacetylase [Planctomycetia bacterium]
MMNFGFQRTLAAPISVEGIGYWSDREITVTFQPAPPNTGLVFVREDLPGKPRIPVSPDFRIAIPRRTSLEKDGARVEMVEHILSALTGMEVDNCEIHVTDVEMPGMDGSALAFVEAFESVGYEIQNLPAWYWTVNDAITQRENPEEKDSGKNTVTHALSTPTLNRAVCVEPAANLEIGFEIRYGEECPIGNQTVEMVLSPEVYRREIAPCRTFVTQKEAEYFQKIGFAKRATFRDLLVFGENGPIQNTLRFPDECVRHKVLDLIGDLALLGGRLHAKVRAFCSGHDLNASLVQQIMAKKTQK